jgi:hypothetical protein
MLKGGFNAKGKVIAACLKREGFLLILPLLSPLFLPLLPFKRPLPLIISGLKRILRAS